MISIDDAGWGCLVGGIIVGAYDDATDRFEAESISYSMFQDENWRQKLYLPAAAEVAVRLLAKLGYERQDILLCTGCCLDGVAKHFDMSGIRYRRGKITGKLQTLIESKLVSYLAGLGFFVSYDELTNEKKKGLLWYKSVGWLKGTPIVKDISANAQPYANQDGQHSGRGPTYLISKRECAPEPLKTKGERSDTYDHNAGYGKNLSHVPG